MQSPATPPSSRTRAYIVRYPPCLSCTYAASGPDDAVSQVQSDLDVFANPDQPSHENDGEDEDGQDNEAATHDVRFVPDDPNFLGVLFTVFSECQALHPEDQEEGEGDFMFNEDEVIRGAGQNGDRWDSLLTMPSPGDIDMLMHPPDDDRFADAEEDDD